MERLVTKLEEAAMTMNSLEESLSNSGNASKAKKEDPLNFKGSDKLQLDMMYEHYLVNNKRGITNEQKGIKNSVKVSFIEDVLSI